MEDRDAGVISKCDWVRVSVRGTLAFIQANANCGMSDISKSLRQDPIKLRPALQLLTAAGTVKATGKKRGTKYYAAGAGAPKKSAAPKPTKKPTSKKKTARKAKRKPVARKKKTAIKSKRKA